MHMFKNRAGADSGYTVQVWLLVALSVLVLWPAVRVPASTVGHALPRLRLFAHACCQEISSRSMNEEVGTSLAGDACLSQMSHASLDVGTFMQIFAILAGYNAGGTLSRGDGHRQV